MSAANGTGIFYLVNDPSLTDFRLRNRTDTAQSVTIDVHYTTTTEALTIVREVLDEGFVSPSRPLRIITGRGSHSVGGVGVLKPAIKRVLGEEGWMVKEWDAGPGLVVRGLK